MIVEGNGELSPEGQLIQEFLHIADKDGNDVPFILNPAQNDLDSCINQIHQADLPVRMDIPKARQKGVTSYLLARLFVKCMTKRNTRARVMAHMNAETQKLLQRVKYYIKYKKGSGVRLSYNTKNELVFPDMDSSFSIYTAGSDEAGRSDTVTDLLCSEVAFWPNPKKKTAGLVQTVPHSGEVFYESTGNGALTWYHRKCLRSQLSKNKLAQLYFIPWNNDMEYRVPMSAQEQLELLQNLEIDYEEQDLLQAHPMLTAEQLLWRRMKVDQFDGDIDLFKQEYPITMLECFMASGANFFHKVHQLKSHYWKQVDKNMRALEGHPRRDFHYVLGVDVAAGVKRDSSVITGICWETGEQVLEYQNDRISPDELAPVLEELGKSFGWPLVVVENNNHGNVLLECLERNEKYPRSMVFCDDSVSSQKLYGGFLTSQKTKPLELGRLRRLLAHGDIKVYSDDLVGQLSIFEEETLKAPEGEHDDLVMSLMMCAVGWRELPFLVSRTEPEVLDYDPAKSPFSFEAIFTGGGQEAQPLASQHSGAEMIPAATYLDY